MSSSSHNSAPKIIAVLGPTNTGKTFYAMDRMLAHASGMIGFPLRLLARENYDKAVSLRGKEQVALVTGEEKIIPKRARYFMCTVEAMPMEQRVEFLAIDEVQMCADPDRGHVFTDRLLNARGRSETLLLGAESMAPLIRRLVRGVTFMSRPRLSKLSYAGTTKINRLNPRSALVAFTANDVYRLAELVRRQRGGAAVVMGALSPRTRNAQVAMYENGEVDYLVATDAIGMGLNLDLKHVAFTATRKFDGQRFRPLTPSELSQIAGRAGRHTNDGTFGTLGDMGPLDSETVSRIENHQFDICHQIFWRNPHIETENIEALTESLREPSGITGLIRVRKADDERALGELCQDQKILARATSHHAVKLLWEVCQIPDFEKEWTIGHTRTLEQFYTHLMDGDGKLPEDWVADHVARIDQTNGDIDALSSRISRIRTWTYISQRADWLDDPTHWQERTRAIENNLSDALHICLTQRFVDKRTTLLVAKLRERDDLVAAIRTDGDVLIEGQFVGHLQGLQFVPDKTSFSADRQVLAGAAAKVIRAEVRRRIGLMVSIDKDDDTDFIWRSNGQIEWLGETIAHVRRGNDKLRPVVDVRSNDYIDTPDRERLAQHLSGWLKDQQDKALAVLFKAVNSNASGAARGLIYQLSEQLGSISRQDASQQVDALSRDDRRKLKSLGVLIGRSVVYMPALLKPAAVSLRARLWNIWQQPAQSFEAPAPGLITIDMGTGQNTKNHKTFLNAIGYQVFDDQAGWFAVRLDMVERIASTAWDLGLKKPFVMNAMLMSLAGASDERTGAILCGIGFRKAEHNGEDIYRLPRPNRSGQTNKNNAAKQNKAKQNSPHNRKVAAKSVQKPVKYNEDSPFAVLKKLTL